MSQHRYVVEVPKRPYATKSRKMEILADYYSITEGGILCFYQIRKVTAPIGTATVEVDTHVLTVDTHVLIASFKQWFSVREDGEPLVAKPVGDKTSS